MKISVIITAYNRKEYLTEAIDSVMASAKETGYDVEVIVSTNFHYNYPASNIKYLNVSKCTLGSQLAGTVSIATGDVLCFLDDDDLFMPEKLHIIGNLFEYNPEITYVRNQIIRKQGDEYSLPAYKPVVGSYPTAYLREEFKRMGGVSELLMANLSAISVRRQYYLNYVGVLSQIPAIPDEFSFYTQLNEDTVVASIAPRLTVYRLHESTSHPVGKQAQIDAIQLGIDSLRIQQKEFTNPDLKELIQKRIEVSERRIGAIE